MFPPMDSICCPAVKFNTDHDVFEVFAKGDLVPVNPANRRFKRTFPIDHPFEFDKRDLDDACLSANM